MEKIGGSASVLWNDRIWHGCFENGWEDQWKTMRSSFSLEDFGMSDSDLTTYKKLLELQNKIQEEMEKYAWTEEGYNATEGDEVKARANYEALAKMFKSINLKYCNGGE